MTVGGQRLDKILDMVDDARTYHDLQKASVALDIHEANVMQAWAKKRASKSFTLGAAISKYREEKTANKKGWQSEGNRLDQLERLPAAKKPLYAITETQERTKNAR